MSKRFKLFMLILSIGCTAGQLNSHASMSADTFLTHNATESSATQRLR